MTHEEAVRHSDELLRETWLAVANRQGELPRDPRWGGYDPVAIIISPRSPRDHVRAALVNQRIAMHPEEKWGKCANCAVFFLLPDEDGTTCSDECFTEYTTYLAGSQGVSLDVFGT